MHSGKFSKNRRHINDDPALDLGTHPSRHQVRQQSIKRQNRIHMGRKYIFSRIRNSLLRRKTLQISKKNIKWWIIITRHNLVYAKSQISKSTTNHSQALQQLRTQTHNSQYKKTRTWPESSAALAPFEGLRTNTDSLDAYATDIHSNVNQSSTREPNGGA